MKVAFILAGMAIAIFVAALLDGCHITIPTSVSPQQITTELIEGGCLAPGPGDVAAVAEQLDAGAPSWLLCMQNGGTISSCSVPCTSPTPE